MTLRAVDNRLGAVCRSPIVDAMSIPSLRIAALAAAGALALALSACTPEAEPSPEPTPTASTALIFASDEEALAAAVEAYEAYESTSHEIAMDGGNKPERIESAVTTEYAEPLKAEFSQYRDAGIHVEGPVSLYGYELVGYQEVDGQMEVSIYVCRDVTEVSVLDSAGLDVTPKDRANVTPLQAFLTGGTASDQLLVDEVELWSGDDFC